MLKNDGRKVTSLCTVSIIALLIVTPLLTNLVGNNGDSKDGRPDYRNDVENSDLDADIYSGNALENGHTITNTPVKKSGTRAGIARTLDRNLEPVIVIGSDIPDFIGSNVTDNETSGSEIDIFIYAWNSTGDTWSQIPFQIDERDSSGSYINEDDQQFEKLDGNDEVVFMVEDMGDWAPANQWVVGANLLKRYEINVTDPLNTNNMAWAYIFKNETLNGIEFTTDYVDYSAPDSIIATNYIIDYQNGNPSITENFTITVAGGGDGTDILDRTKLRMSMFGGMVNINENDASSVIQGIVDGPVRVIKKTGSGSDDTLLFYYKSLTRTDSSIDLPANTDYIILYSDYLSSAVPMTYYDENNGGGVTIDGIDDPAIVKNPLPLWQEATGPKGSVVTVTDPTSVTAGSKLLYWKDDSTYDDGTGSEQPGAYGNGGVQLNNPAEQTAVILSKMFILPANQGNVGSTYGDYYNNPLNIDITFVEGQYPNSSVLPLPPYETTTIFNIDYTANDWSGSGIKNVTLWYNNSYGWTSYGNFTSSPISFDTSLTGGNGIYEFYTIARDNMSNEEPIPATNDTWTIVDTTVSSIADTLPIYETTTPFIGNATTASDLSGITNVTFYYSYSSDGMEYDPWESFGQKSSPPWSWSFTAPNGDGYYQFYSIANDTAGNTELAPPGNDTWTIVDTAIGSSVDTQPIYQTNTVFTVTATTASDLSGITNVTLYYSYSSDGASYGAYLQFNQDVAAPWSWDFVAPNSNGYYQFYSIANDTAGNIENAPANNDTWTIVDVGVSSSVNALPAYTTNKPFPVTGITASDMSSVTNVTLYYSYSLDGITYGPWMAFGKDFSSPWSWSFTAPNGDGYYQFYSIANDTAGNTELAPPGNDTWTIVDTAIGSSVDTQPIYQTNTVFTVTATTASDLSGITNVTLYYSYSSDGASYGAYLQFGQDVAAPWSWDFVAPNGNGYYQFYTIANDTAGNTEGAPVANDTWTVVDTTVSSIADALGSYQTSLSFIITATTLPDLSGINNVTLLYSYSSDSTNYGQWIVFGKDYSPPWSWSFTAPNGDGFYQFHSIANDSAGNNEFAPPGNDTWTIIDTTDPTSNAGALPTYETTSTFSIAYTASDANGIKNVILWYKKDTDIWTNYGDFTSSPILFDSSITGGDGIYQFYTIAIDIYGNEESVPAGNDTWTVVDTIPPEKPTGLTVNISGRNGDALMLNWNANTEGDVAGYNIYRSTTSGSGYIQINTELISGTSFQDTGLTPGTTYYYVITAFDNALSESDYSIEAFGIPDIDTDGDGIGNTKDTDDDGDGLSVLWYLLPVVTIILILLIVMLLRKRRDVEPPGTKR